jgi:deoxyribonuclease V
MPNHQKEKMGSIQPKWDLTPSDAVALQKRLSGDVIRKSRLTTVKTVAGIDTGYRDGMSQAAIVSFKYPDLEPLEQSISLRPVNFPYIPGLLSFREAPVILKAVEKLKQSPDLLIIDGHGIAHPRRFGIACHIGLLLDVPSIGCAKTLLVGEYDEPNPERGAFSYLKDQGEIIGAVLRTRSNVKPVFVSIGHRVDLQDCIQFVLNCCRGFRLPETTRRADRLSVIEKLV